MPEAAAFRHIAKRGSRREGRRLPKRIAFLLPDLSGGGAERLTIDLAAGCLGRGHAVDLVLLRKRGPFLELVPPGARVIELGVDRLRGALVP